MSGKDTCYVQVRAIKSSELHFSFPSLWQSWKTSLDFSAKKTLTLRVSEDLLQPHWS